MNSYRVALHYHLQSSKLVMLFPTEPQISAKTPGYELHDIMYWASTI